jgi:hypothetical protein
MEADMTDEHMTDSILAGQSAKRASGCPSMSGITLLDGASRTRRRLVRYASRSLHRTATRRVGHPDGTVWHGANARSIPAAYAISLLIGFYATPV